MVVIHFESQPRQNNPPRLLNDLPAPPRNPHPPRLLLSNSRNAARTPGSTAFRRHVRRPMPPAGVIRSDSSMEQCSQLASFRNFGRAPNWLRSAAPSAAQIGFASQPRPSLPNWLRPAAWYEPNWLRFATPSAAQIGFVSKPCPRHNWLRSTTRCRHPRHPALELR